MNKLLVLIFIFSHHHILSQDLNNYLSIRHRGNIQQRINQSKIAKGVYLGNSIMQGAGTNCYDKTIPRNIAAKLRSFAGYGSTDEWTGHNYGVGGATTANVVNYVSNFWNSESTLNQLMLENLDYAFILTTRNDPPSLTVSDMEQLLEVTINQLKQRNIDIYIIIDPPAIITENGELRDTKDNWLPWYNKVKEVALKSDVSVIDSWAYFKNIFDQGFDLRNYTHDGVHPNSDGFDAIANLIYAGIMTNPKNSNCYSRVRCDTNQIAYSNYFPRSGTSINTTPYCCVNTKSTGRSVALNERSTHVFSLAQNDFIEFEIPNSSNSYIITCIDCQGSIDVKYNNTTIQENITWPSVPTERSLYYKIPFELRNSDQNNLTIKCRKGHVNVSNITTIANQDEQDTPFLDPCEKTVWKGESLIFGNQMFTESGNYPLIFEPDQGCDSTVLLSLNVIDSDTPGMTYNDNNIKLSLYPNPTRKFLTINTDQPFSGQFSLINISGIDIMNYQVENSRKSQIDLSTLPNGIYFLHTIKKGKIIVRAKITKV